MLWGNSESYSMVMLAFLGYFLLRFFSKLIAWTIFIVAVTVFAAVFLKI
jgi:hypothetical protein